MEPPEFWRWNIPHSHKPGKLQATRYRLTGAEALAMYPTATNVPDPMGVRKLPETDGEAIHPSTTGLSQRLQGYRPR